MIWIDMVSMEYVPTTSWSIIPLRFWEVKNHPRSCPLSWCILGLAPTIASPVRWPVSHLDGNFASMTLENVGNTKRASWRRWQSQPSSLTEVLQVLVPWKIHASTGGTNATSGRQLPRELHTGIERTRYTILHVYIVVGDEHPFESHFDVSLLGYRGFVP